MNTIYPTYLIGFTNTSTKRIFQDATELKKIIEVAQIEGSNIDINSLKELNGYDRFVKLKRMPEWLLLLISREVERITTETIMQKNEM